MHNLIVTLEGHIRTGKTTTLKALYRDYGMYVVPEYYTFKQGNITYPAYPPLSTTEAEATVDFFINLEMERFDYMYNYPPKLGQPIMLDRSIYSILAFQKCVMDRFPDTPNAYHYSLHRIKEEISRCTIRVPNALIHFTLPGAQIFRNRLDERGRVSIDFLNEPKTFLYMTDFYREIGCIYEQKEAFCEIDTSEQGLTRCPEVVYNFATTHEPTEITFDAFYDLYES